MCASRVKEIQLICITGSMCDPENTISRQMKTQATELIVISNSPVIEDMGRGVNDETSGV